MRYFVLLLCCCAQTIIAQTFHASPRPLLQQEVALEQATECYIFFENTGTDSLQLRWKKLEASFPSEWTIDLCDFGTCYIGIPAAATMNTAASNEQPYLKLIVQPGSTAGAGWIVFRAWENGNPSNFADVFFSLHTDGVTSTNTVQAPDIQIFPNPVTTALNLENNFDQAMPASVFNASGQMQWTGTLYPSQRTPIDCTNWPAGQYFLITNNKSYTILRVP